MGESGDSLYQTRNTLSSVKTAKTTVVGLHWTLKTKLKAISNLTKSSWVCEILLTTTHCRFDARTCRIAQRTSPQCATSTRCTKRCGQRSNTELVDGGGVFTRMAQVYVGQTQSFRAEVLGASHCEAVEKCMASLQPGLEFSKTVSL